MNSLILRTFSRLLVALMLMVSLFLLLRGHNLPGGGFLGGLVAAAGLILLAISEGPKALRAALRVRPESVACAGLGIAIVAGLAGIFAEAPFLTGLWLFIGAEEGGKGLPLGTPLLFDVGVYLVVIGAISGAALALEEEV